MNFVPVSENNLINLDNIDVVRVDTIELDGVKKKVIMIVVGGTAYRVEDKYATTVLPLLLTKGNNLSNQYFSV